MEAAAEEAVNRGGGSRLPEGGNKESNTDKDQPEENDSNDEKFEETDDRK